MTKLPFAATVVTMVSSLGCGLPLTEPEPTVRNRCDTDAACGPSGACVQQQCVATSADLTGLIIRIDVPSSASYGGGTRNLVFGDDLDVPLQGSQPEGFWLTQDIVTTPLASVTAELAVDGLATACDELVAEDGTFPISVELQPTGVPAGLSLEAYAATTPEEAESTAAVGASVPQGTYDVYVVPQTPDAVEDGTTSDLCRLPPTLITARKVNQAEVPVRIGVAPPAVLRGTIEGFPVVGWTIDLVENVRGRPISTRATITESGTSASFELRYWPQLLEDADIDAVVRLQPPDEARSQGMPTVLWNLDALSIFGDAVAIDLTALADVTPVAISPTVADAEDAVGVPATVTIQSSQLLNGELGGNVTYKATVETDAAGSFSASLIPGQYVFHAQPSDDAYANTSVALEVTADDLQGRTLPLQPKRLLSGTATTPLGEPAFGIPAVVKPTSTNRNTFLQNQLGVIDLKPNATSTKTDALGGFFLATDPGEYNLSLEPDEALPWSVVSRLIIPDTEGPVPPINIRFSHPVVLQGGVWSPTGAAIPGAVIRAYLTPPPDADGETPGVIQVAETSSNANGGYELLLPTSIQANVAQP